MARKKLSDQIRNHQSLLFPSLSLSLLDYFLAFFSFLYLIKGNVLSLKRHLIGLFAANDTLVGSDSWYADQEEGKGPGN